MHHLYYFHRHRIGLWDFFSYFDNWFGKVRVYIIHTCIGYFFNVLLMQKEKGERAWERYVYIFCNIYIEYQFFTNKLIIIRMMWSGSRKKNSTRLWCTSFRVHLAVGTRGLRGVDPWGGLDLIYLYILRVLSLLHPHGLCLSVHLE